MHRIFGSKTDAPYYTRKGAYLIPVDNTKIGVVKTPKGFFLLGGGLEAAKQMSNASKESAEKRQDSKWQ